MVRILLYLTVLCICIFTIVNPIASLAPSCFQNSKKNTKDNNWGGGGGILSEISLKWVKIFRIIPDFRILRVIFHKKLATKNTE